MVADPHHLHADPDSVFNFNADPDLAFYLNAGPDLAVHFNASGICNHWSLDLPGLHFESQGLHYKRTRPSLSLFQPLKLLNFDFNAASDPAFHSNTDADPDSASKNNADLCGSGSATLTAGIQFGMVSSRAGDPVPVYFRKDPR
jgi:hypothetical protein